ncbi:MAG: hypothetical protein NVV63_10930 [Opitutus sp.]|nr:hypothetical protein [Opitutus sp.]
MNLLNTLKPAPRSLEKKSILSREGFEGAIVTLQAGEGNALTEPAARGERVIVVLEGEVTLECDGIHTVLNREEATLVLPDRECTLRATGAGRTRVLKLDVPARQVVNPPLVAVEN